MIDKDREDKIIDLFSRKPRTNSNKINVELIEEISDYICQDPIVLSSNSDNSREDMWMLIDFTGDVVLYLGDKEGCLSRHSKIKDKIVTVSTIRVPHHILRSFVFNKIRNIVGYVSNMRPYYNFDSNGLYLDWDKYENYLIGVQPNVVR